MILLSGSPFDPAEWSGDYPAGSVERLVLDEMSRGRGTYAYDSPDQLRFELRLRREIVNAARDLNRSGFGFAVFHKSRCNPAYWERTDDGGFRLLPGADPAAAIDDIFKNGRAYATECATAMVIVYYRALLRVFGEDLFRRLFPSIYLMNWHTLDPLLQEVGRPQQAADILIGDRGYFSNPDVDPETPQWIGENVIVLPDSLYYGHGVGIKTADKIIRALNANRREDAAQSAHFLDSVARPNFKKLAKASERAAVRNAPLVWKPFPAALRTI